MPWRRGRGNAWAIAPSSDLSARRFRSGVDIAHDRTATRHLPVVVDGCLVGIVGIVGIVSIVSIGDVVKRRVDELELLNEEMVQHIRGR
jgi:hypothetical protein